MRHGAVNDKVKEECGVFGACLDGDAAQACAYGLTALQHRGQEGAGVAVSDGAAIRSGDGLVAEVFPAPSRPDAGMARACSTARPAVGDIEERLHCSPSCSGSWAA